MVLNRALLQNVILIQKLKNCPTFYGPLQTLQSQTMLFQENKFLCNKQQQKQSTH
jgi:hypothetical protein